MFWFDLGQCYGWLFILSGIEKDPSVVNFPTGVQLGLHLEVRGVQSVEGKASTLDAYTL